MNERMDRWMSPAATDVKLRWRSLSRISALMTTAGQSHTSNRSASRYHILPAGGVKSVQQGSSSTTIAVRGEAVARY